MTPATDLLGDREPLAVQTGRHVLLGLQGVLAEHAHAWDSDTGDVRLEVVLHQALPGHPNAVPIVAVQHYTGPSRALDLQAARNKAAGLRRGDPVTVIGLDIQPGTRAKQPVLKLLHVFAIEHSEHLPGPALQPPAHLCARPTPSGQEAAHHA